MSATSALLIIVAAICSCAGNLFIKLATLNEAAQKSILGTFLNGYFVFGVLSFMLNLVLFSFALKNTAVSLGYPLLATLSFVLLTATSALVLGEKLQIQQYIGITVALIGVLLIATDINLKS